jgi:hypothetical protein
VLIGIQHEFPGPHGYGADHLQWRWSRNGWPVRRPAALGRLFWLDPGPSTGSAPAATTSGADPDGRLCNELVAASLAGSPGRGANEMTSPRVCVGMDDETALRSPTVAATVSVGDLRQGPLQRHDAVGVECDSADERRLDVSNHAMQIQTSGTWVTLYTRWKA